MKSLVLPVLHELSHQRFVSGTVLAQKLHVSRSTISEILKEVAPFGIDIFSVPGRGYRLARPLDMLDASAIQKMLQKATPPVQVEIMAHVDSTNSELLRRAAQGEASGLCLAAEIQSQGRGRRGRRWESALGSGLTFSLLWRFERGAAQLGGLSLVVGLALVQTLRGVGISRAQVKWPNDIWVDGQKLAGILIETQGDMLGPSAAVIGIGINYRLTDALKEQIDQPVCDIAAFLPQLPSRNELLGSLLMQLAATLERFAQHGFTGWREEWIAAHALHEKPVCITHGDGTTLNAVVKGVAPDGALIVSAQGKEMMLTSGEISLRINKK